MYVCMYVYMCGYMWVCVFERGRNRERKNRNRNFTPYKLDLSSKGLLRGQLSHLHKIPKMGSLSSRFTHNGTMRSHYHVFYRRRIE